MNHGPTRLRREYWAARVGQSGERSRLKLTQISSLTSRSVTCRNFFPEDNFGEKRVWPIPRLAESFSQPSQSQSQPGLSKLNVTTLKKGVTHQADAFIGFLVSH